LLNRATDPSLKSRPSEGSWNENVNEPFPIRLKLNRPGTGLIFKIHVGNSYLYGSLPGVASGEYRVRLGEEEFWPPLLYVSQSERDAEGGVRDGKTWAYSLDSFRDARSDNKNGSPTLLRPPFETLQKAQSEAPQWVYLSRWLADRRRGIATPSPEGLTVDFPLSDAKRPNGSIVNVHTGRVLVVLTAVSP
jgi:hypothetical protein